MRNLVLAAFAAMLLICPRAAFAQYETAIICDAVVAGRCATVAADGSLKVGATVNVSGAADLAGNTATFNANNVCTSVITAGEQSVSFHLDSGTLAATLTAFVTNNIGAVNCASAGTCTATTFSSGATIIVTNPNGVKDVSVTALGRQTQVCTTAFTSGSATGVVTATYLNASSSSGGGGGVVTQGTGTNLHTVTDATSVTAATQSGTWTVQPGNTANTTAWKVDGSAVTQPVSIAATVNDQGLGTAGAASGGVLSVQAPDAVGGGNPFSVATFGANTVSAVRAPTFAAATNLTTSCSSATACAVTASIQWAVSGQIGAEVVITAIASPVGFTLACDTGYDNNATYLLGDCAFNQAGVFKKTLANADLTAGNKFTLSWLGSPSFVRVRVSAVTSGQFTAAGIASTAFMMPGSVEAKPPTQATVTLTASTSETTLLAAGGSGVFLDLTYLKCSNTSATASAISIRDATAGTVRDTLVCPAAIGPCEGNVYRVPFAQTTSNANWTIQAGTGASSLICTAQAVQR